MPFCRYRLVSVGTPLPGRSSTSIARRCTNPPDARSAARMRAVGFQGAHRPHLAAGEKTAGALACLAHPEGLGVSQFTPERTSPVSPALHVRGGNRLDCGGRGLDGPLARVLCRPRGDLLNLRRAGFIRSGCQRAGRSDGGSHPRRIPFPAIARQTKRVNDSAYNRYGSWCQVWCTLKRRHAVRMRLSSSGEPGGSSPDVTDRLVPAIPPCVPPEYSLGAAVIVPSGS